MPKGVYQRQPGVGLRLPWTPPCTAGELRSRYDAGATQIEIAHALGVTLKVIQTAMRRFGIKPRRQIKRDQRRERNDSWKGDAAGYSAKHLRMTVSYGQPSICEFCGSTDPSREYEWASKYGKYDSRDDFFRLCQSCHSKYDVKINNIWGSQCG